MSINTVLPYDRFLAAIQEKFPGLADKRSRNDDVTAEHDDMSTWLRHIGQIVLVKDLNPTTSFGRDSTAHMEAHRIWGEAQLKKLGGVVELLDGLGYKPRFVTP